MTTAPSPSHVRAAQSRKAAQRTFIRYTNAHIEAEIEGKAPPSKRKRFYPLLLTERADPTPISAEPERGVSTFALLMFASTLLILLSFAVKAGFFAWRPGDQAVSTIDHRLAPHLEPMKGTVK